MQVEANRNSLQTILSGSHQQASTIQHCLSSRYTATVMLPKIEDFAQSWL